MAAHAGASTDDTVPSRDEVTATLTAVGGSFEMEEVVIRGIPTRTWKTAPATLRSVFELSPLHGDKDFLVPIQQAERIVEKLTAEKVPCKLVVKPGAGHGWAGMDKELVLFADWFDEHLAKKK